MVRMEPDITVINQAFRRYVARCGRYYVAVISLTPAVRACLCSKEPRRKPSGATSNEVGVNRASI